MTKNFRLFLSIVTSVVCSFAIVPMLIFGTMLATDVLGIGQFDENVHLFFVGQNWLHTVGNGIVFGLFSLMGGLGLILNIDIALNGKECE